MRIGVLYKPDVPNTFYRAFGPAGALKDAGHEVVLVEQKPNHRVDPAPLQRCDVVHIYRRADPIVLGVAQDLQRRGIAVTWDNDDDIRLAPADSPLAKQMAKLDIKRDFDWQKKMLRCADLVTTTSRYLVDEYRGITDAPVVQIENYLSEHQFPRAPRRHDGLVLGWVAGYEHIADERALGISSILREVMARNPGVRVVSIGVQLDVDKSRYTHHRLLPFPSLRDHIRQFDIGIAPLADLPMSYARSNVKVKEYAGAGIPWLASNRGPYVDLGVRQGGRLVDDDAWPEAIETLVASRLKRARLGRQAKSWGKTQALRHHVARWSAAFETAMDARADARRAQARRA